MPRRLGRSGKKRVRRGPHVRFSVVTDPLPSSSTSMVQSTLSHSQALRVVGQRLHADVTAFEISKNDENYVVHVRAEPDVAANSASLVVRFTPVDIFMDDAVRKLRRVRPSGLSDLTHLSDGLRVLGDYLDRNDAVNFTILWSGYSAKVSSAGKEQCFTPQNLYDLGILMQLKSSSRARRCKST